MNRLNKLAAIAVSAFCLPAYAMGAGGAELDANGRQKVFRAMVPQYPNDDGPAASGSRTNHEEPAT